MRIFKYITRILLYTVIFNSVIFSQWVALNTGTSQNLRSVYFTDLQTGFVCGEFGTIIKTTNSGTNWIALNSGTTYNLRSIQFINASTGLCCGYSPTNGFIIKTTNGGANWNPANSGNVSQLTSIYFYNSSAAVCVGNSGTTLYSTDGGSNWLVGQPTGYLVTFYTAYMISASTGYCGGVNTIFSPLFAKTTNGGANWVYSSFMVNNNEATLMDMHFFSELSGIAVSVLWNGQGGISQTTNGGGNWTHQIVTYALYGIDFAGMLTGYIAGSNGSILKSTNGGASWNQQATGISAFLRAIDFIDSLNGYAAGDGGVVLKTTNGGILGFSQINNEIPKEYKLFQNYPNPFNPVTKIRFAISTPPQPSPKGRGQDIVILKVYDILGREIQILVNEQLSPGTYEAEFDGSNYPSGVYLYTLLTGDFKSTRKLILMK